MLAIPFLNPETVLYPVFSAVWRRDEVSNREDQKGETTDDSRGKPHLHGLARIAHSFAPNGHPAHAEVSNARWVRPGVRDLGVSSVERTPLSAIGPIVVAVTQANRTAHRSIPELTRSWTCAWRAPLCGAGFVDRRLHEREGQAQAIFEASSPAYVCA